MGELLIRVPQEYSFPPPEIDWQVRSYATYHTPPRLLLLSWSTGAIVDVCILDLPSIA